MGQNGWGIRNYVGYSGSNCNYCSAPNSLYFTATCGFMCYNEVSVPWQPTLDQWYHFSMVRASGVLNWYIDGELIGTSTFNVNIQDLDQPWRIGAVFDVPNGVYAYLNGKYHQTNVWKRALSQDEVQTSMNGNLDAVDPTNLMARWDLNEGDGTIANDASGRNHNATFYGNADWNTDIPFILDCLGIPNGDAVEDNCGACDNDSSNDCIEDCTGEWGGAIIA
jgi:hypothetical protein